MKYITRRLLILSSVFILAACNGGSSSSSLVKLEIKNVSISGYESRHTEIQSNYLDNGDPTDTTPYNGNMSVSNPNPVKISWKSNREPENGYKVNIFRNYEEEPVVTYVTKDKTFDFYNTEVGTTYHINISAEEVTTEKVDFSMSNKGPRNLFIEGVENVRDLGGWGYIKQGLIYRSGRFNEDKAETVTPSITEDGLYEVNNHLKIKTEIDLRRTSVNEVGGLTDKSVLGDDVNYVSLPMYYGGNNILTFTGKASKDDYEYNNPAMIKRFFEILSNRDNYPIDFHCSIGKDRTGCLAYLVGALCGFDQETLYRDYMFTNFANAGMCKITDLTDRYAKTLDEYEGTDLEHKTFYYLHDVIGLENETLENVIEILRD